jgi:hypothetical protein
VESHTPDLDDASLTVRAFIVVRRTGRFGVTTVID